MLLLLNPRMIRKRPWQVNQEASQEDRSMCKGAQVEPTWLGQSCRGGAGRQQPLLDLFTQVNGETQETEDGMPFCTVNVAWLDRRQAERSPLQGT